MAIQVPDLATLDSSEVQQSLDYTVARVLEQFPNLKVTHGVVQELVLKMHAIMAAANSSVVADKVDRSSSLLMISEDPEGADQTQVDRVMSNFRISRAAGSKSSGQVTIILNKFLPVTIPQGTVFEANGVPFVTPTVFAGRISSSAVSSNTDRLIVPSGTDQYAFTIEVEASNVGLSGQVKRLTSIRPKSLIPYFQSAFAASDFSGGTDADTNEDLLVKLQNGLSDRSSSNRYTIDSMIRNSDDFNRLVDLSVIGYGDSEQIRYHSLFPIATGSKVDLYARTRSVPENVPLTKTATLVRTTVDGGIWQFTLSRDEVPGFYEISQIVLDGTDETLQTGYEVKTLFRSTDLSDYGVGTVPDIEDDAESAFTRFQTGIVQFLDTDTDLTNLEIGAQQDYKVSVLAMPQIAELQAYLCDRSRRPMSDLLVKAPVPCFLSVNFVIKKPVGYEDPDVTEVKSAICEYVNSVKFEGIVSASSVAHAALQLLPAKMTIGAIDLFGRILYPNGEVKYVRSDTALQIPDNPTEMVTARTVAVFLDPDSIGISITS